MFIYQRVIQKRAVPHAIQWVKIEDPGDHLLLQLRLLQPSTAFHTQLLGHRCSPGPNGELRGLLAVVGRQGSSVASAEMELGRSGKRGRGSTPQVTNDTAMLWPKINPPSFEIIFHLGLKAPSLWCHPQIGKKKQIPFIRHCSTTQSCPVSCWEPSDCPKFPPRPVLGADLRMSVFPGLLPPWWNKGQSSPVTAPAASFNVFAGPGRHVAGMSCEDDMSKTKETKVSPDPEETESLGVASDAYLEKWLAWALSPGFVERLQDDLQISNIYCSL